jgi:hypothetical protein
MNEQWSISEALIREISRYLAAVEVFRAERCEPTWLPELAFQRAPEKHHLRPERFVSDVPS